MFYTLIKIPKKHRTKTCKHRLLTVKPQACCTHPNGVMEGNKEKQREEENGEREWGEERKKKKNLFVKFQNNDNSNIAGDAYVFQQDSAPVHCVRQTVELLQGETPKFIAPNLWPQIVLILTLYTSEHEVLCRIVFARRQFKA